MANIIGQITINQSSFFELDANPLSSSTTGFEIGDLCFVDGIEGLWQKNGSTESDFIRVDIESALSTQATLNHTLLLSPDSNNIQAFTGTVAGQIVQLPDATLLPRAQHYIFLNDSTQKITIKDNNSNILSVLGPNGRVHFRLADKSSSAGTWINEKTGSTEHLHILEVWKDPGPNDFSSVADAANSILSSGPTEPWIIKVGPGIFTEPVISLPPNVSVTGSTIATTIIEPDSDSHHIFVMGTVTELSFMTIRNAGAGFAAVACLDSGDYAQVHKASLFDNDIHILIESSTVDTICYLEYIDINGNYTNGIKAISTNGFVAGCNAENYYTFPAGNTSNEVLVNGPMAYLELEVCTFNGQNNTGIVVTNGGSLECRNIEFDNLDTAILSVNSGSNSSIKISGSQFSDNAKNINIQNITTVGFCDGYISYGSYSIIAGSTFFINGKDPHYITVGKTGFDFTTIKDACDAVLAQSPSSSKRFKIRVYPGIYVEPTINVPIYTTIYGESRTDVVVIPNANNHHVFVLTGISSSVASLTVSGAGSGYAAFASVNAGKSNGIEDVTMYNCDTGILCSASTLDTTFYANLFDIVGTYTHAIKVIGTSGFVATMHATSFSTSLVVCSTEQFYLSGVGCRLELHNGDIDGCGTDTGIYATNGSILHANAAVVNGSNIALHIPSSANPTELRCSGISVKSVTNDILIEDSGTFGGFIGLADRSKVSVNSLSPISISYAGYDSVGGFTVLKDLYQGDKQDRLLNISKLARSTSTLGAVTGGVISSVSGRTISISAGSGFLLDPTDKFIKEITWITTQKTIPAGEDHFIYIDTNGLVITSISPQDLETVIFLGRSYANSSSVEFVENVPMNVGHHGNEIEETLRESIGPIFGTGAGVTEYGTRGLTVTGGSYYYGSVNLLSVGGNPISWEEYYHSSSVWVGNTSVSTIQNTSYDSAGNLVAMTAGYYRKDSLYLLGDDTTEKYFVVTGQAQYSTPFLAKEATLPNPPSWIKDGITIIASIVVEQGQTHFELIEDLRPRIGFKPAGIAGVLAHGDLTGLTNDDHPLYLPVSGTRAMTGNLQMGSQNITGVNLVDGVDVSNHASRHLPNSGTDALTCAAAVSISASNTEGSANSLARSDHTHAGVAALKVDNGTSRVGTINLLSGIGAILSDDGLGNFTFSTNAATTQLFASHSTLLNIDYTSGSVIVNGVFTAVSAGSIVVDANKSNWWIYVDVDGVVKQGSTLPSNSIAMAQFSSNVTSVTSISDRRTYINNNAVFGIPTTSLSSTTSNAGGSSNNCARADHTHAILTGIPSSQVPDQVNNAGSSANLAKADHIHNIATATPSSIGSANAQGSSVTAFSKADHVHQGVRSMKALVGGTQRFGDVVVEQGTNITIVDSPSGTFTVNATNQVGTGLKIKSGTVALGSFTGDPRKATVTFPGSAFSTANYAITITGTDNRNWTWESKLAGSFIINSNAKAALTGNVDWIAIYVGESN